MTKTIVNLTATFVQSEANEILAANALEAYQPLFAAASTRDRLMSYVISRIPGLYAVVDEEAAFLLQCDTVYCSSELREQIQQLVHQGIHHILQESSLLGGSRLEAIASSPAFSEEQAASMPSHWFG